MLVSDGYVAKISDFGLARDVYDNLEYVKVTPVCTWTKHVLIYSICEIPMILQPKKNFKDCMYSTILTTHIRAIFLLHFVCPVNQEFSHAEFGRAICWVVVVKFQN